ncbi:uncharacterized protein isoform X2 [Leptinotarsa decemlineata]|uniref:uncharacterized protein isoform X2 n=1 Tax=Leptinotarsa decemlineata TaxID=7539 RepID=UPI000C252534|nr:uncharacterized protein LOC111514537 [Leptinotarsa decemlineata]
MVVLDVSRNEFGTNRESLEIDTSLQEERRKTGRCLAAGIVLFLVVLGLYHVVPEGSTRLSALLGAALIMFFYLLWLLYSSNRKKRILKARELAMKREVRIIFDKQTIPTAAPVLERVTPQLECHHQTLGRSYSIA